MIPRIIHYIWVGSKPLPDPDKRRVETWQKMLPDWEFRAWGNENLDYSSSYLRQAYSVRAWNRVSDYTRMDALVQFGGVYLDTDVDIIRPFDPLLSAGAFLGFQASDDRPHELVNGAVFGAKLGHWLPTTIRAYFNEKLDGRTDIGTFSGPGLLTQILRENGLQSCSDSPFSIQDLIIYPRRYFYPYSWLETYSDSVVGPDTYAVHRWAETWFTKRDLRARLRRRAIYGLAQVAPEVAFRLSRAVTRQGSR